MMRLYKMFMLRWKAGIRQPHIWAFVVLAVLASLIPASSSRYQSDSKLPIAVVNEDKGSASYDLESYLEAYEKLLVYYLEKDKALRYLAMGRVEAVFIVEDGFTDCVQNDIYEGIITMYTAPASSAAVLLSETVINSALMVWMVETALYKVDGFVKAEGISYTAEKRQEMHDEFNYLLHNGSVITVEEHIPEPDKTGGINEPVLSSMGWYASLMALFVIMGAGWVIETRKQALGERMSAIGIHPVTALAGSSLAVIAISMLGWLVSAVFSSVAAGFSVTVGLSTFLPMLLYMLGVMGITFFLTSILNGTVQLMLVAPVLTIAQGVICGMLLELPDWAGLLYYVSCIFPGRFFMLASDALLHKGKLVHLLSLAGVSLIWLALGGMSVLAKSRRAMERLT